MRIIKSDFCDSCPHHQEEKPCGCENQHGAEEEMNGESVEDSDGENILNNPSLKQDNESDVVTPSKVVLIKMVGNTSDIAIEDILKMIENIIPFTEKEGMDEEVERLQMAAAKLEKAAEYEDWGVYWIANGRAFEKSYKEKKEKKGDSPSAATEAWMETLEEFQKALIDDAFSFTEKYAAKKAEEKADAGGCGSSSTGIMSKEMTDRYKKIKKRSEEGGISEGEALSEWLDEQQERKKSASVMLLNKISSKMENGEHPGVSVYESIEDLSNISNNVKKEAIAELGNVYAMSIAKNRTNLREVLAFGFLDRLTSPLTGLWSKMTHGVGDFLSKEWSKGGKPFKKLRKINKLKQIIYNELDKQLSRLSGGGLLPASSIQKALDTKGFYSILKGFLEDISKGVSSVKPAPDPNDFSSSGYLTVEQYKNFLADLMISLEQVNEENAQAAYYSRASVAIPDITNMPSPEDNRLKANIVALVNKINTVTNDLEMALPSYTIPSNIFDPVTIQAHIDSINIPSIMSSSMKNIDKGEDKETEASQISEKILKPMDQILEQYIINNIKPIMVQLINQFSAPGVTRQQQVQINQQSEHTRSAVREIRSKWDETKLKIEQEVAKTLSLRFNRINQIRQKLNSEPSQRQNTHQPATNPAGA